MKSLVSVVIPAYNSEATIKACLKSIKEQTYSNIEIIVVDKYSTDMTRKIAEMYGAKVYTMGPERAAQVNLGMRKAKGRYFYRVDSDFFVEPEVVEEAVKRCEDGYDAVCVHNASDPTISFWSKVRNLERECYVGDELIVAARFFRREVFESLNGFDETLIGGEDYDFHNRILEKGYKVGRVRSKEVHLGEPSSLLDIIKKHYYYGKTIGRFTTKNPKKGWKQIQPVRVAYFRNWEKFVQQPTLTMGFLLYQVTRYCSAALGYLVSEVSK
ncbi:MAG: glycosyltransferase [Candidatus Bathyarchaeota archaeon]|nr:glycosyltransferase [Candidatus Bathyarchaeota archaeon]